INESRRALYLTADPLAPSTLLARDERQVAQLVVDVQPVPVHEGVLDREAQVVDWDLDLAARRLREQGGDLHARRPVVLQVAEQVDHRYARVDYVLHEDHVLACDRYVAVLDQLHAPRGLGDGHVAGAAEEGYGPGHGNGPREDGHEGDSPVQGTEQRQ